MRYIAKPIGKLWGVYDRQEASWPVNTLRTGPVKQDMKTEQEALEEARRLNEKGEA